MESAFTNTLSEFVSEESWVVRIFVVVLLTVVVDFVSNRILIRAHRTVAATRNFWDDALIEAATSPLRVMVWVVGLYLAMAVAQGEQQSFLFSYLTPLRDLGVIVLLAWFLSRFIKRGEESYIKQCQMRGESVDRTTADAIAKLLRLSVIITAALVALQTLGYSISGVLAFGGVGGIAVGFAAKDLLSNFFGGLMVYLDRPFSVGDWVRSPDRDIEGTVERIGWRLTVIRTFDKRPLYIPNSLFTNIVVENPSRMTNRRIYETIGIRYDDIDHMADIVADVKAMLAAHDDIDSNQTMIVNFNEFSASSLDFFVYTFTRTTRWVEFHAIKQDVMLKISDIIARHGAEIAFPTSTIHLDPGAPPPVE